MFTLFGVTDANIKPNITKTTTRKYTKNYAYSFSGGELDEKISTTVISVN